MMRAWLTTRTQLTHSINQSINRSIDAGPVLNKSAAEEDKKLMPADVSLEGPLIRYGLTDWKLYVPLGLALSVPFLANEVSACVREKRADAVR